MALKKKRTRRQHPGVVFMKPDGKHGWRGRYINPDHTPGGPEPRYRVEKVPDSATTAEARERWAAALSDRVRKRREELVEGAVRRSGVALADAIGTYHKAHPHLRERTKEIYTRCGSALVSWAKGAGVKSCDNLTRARLMAFRESVIAKPRRVAVKGAARGAYADTAEQRSPTAINQELRAVRTMLGYLVDRDTFPFLRREDLATGLKQLKDVTEVIEYLRPAQVQALVAAALGHDAARFAETRAEHRGAGERGKTARYDPIAPFVLTVLLTGMRFGEVLGLEWAQVDLDDGKIVLRGEGVKTRRGRIVSLEVSPALHALLARMHKERGEAERVFASSRHTVDAAAARLMAEYGAPAFTWQMLRRTCGTYLTNAPGIFGAASAYRSAKQLGHSVVTAEKAYLGVVSNIPADARTLEAAMGIADEINPWVGL